MDFQPLKYIYQPSTSAAANTLVLLHGTGGDENDLIPLAKQFGADFNILSLRGNVLEHGMPRFFKRLGMGIFDEKDLEFRAAELAHRLENLSVSLGFDFHRMIALGYSNGANIAGALLVNHPQLLSGAILFRPMQPFKTLPTISGANSAIFMSNGKMDPTVDAHATHQYVNALKAAGFKVSDHHLNTSHNLTQEDLDLAKEWYWEFKGEREKVKG
jgi:phospholipase/carboxylesterase